MDPSTHRYQRHRGCRTPRGCPTHHAQKRRGERGTKTPGGVVFFFFMKGPPEGRFLTRSLWCQFSQQKTRNKSCTCAIPGGLRRRKHSHLLIELIKVAICKVRRFNNDLQANNTKLERTNDDKTTTKRTRYICQKMRIVGEQWTLSVIKKKAGLLQSERKIL